MLSGHTSDRICGLVVLRHAGAKRGGRREEERGGREGGTRLTTRILTMQITHARTHIRAPPRLSRHYFLFRGVSGAFGEDFERRKNACNFQKSGVKTRARQKG